MAVVPRERQFGWEVWLRFSWAVTYKLGTVVGAVALAVLAFSQGSKWWDIVGAVLTGSAIADVLLLIAAAWFRWRHRSEL
jgi:membrane protein YdbS with pleckstrin-like domain